MKILFLANRLPHEKIAGGHKLIYQRMQALIKMGHEVGLACLVDPGCQEHIEEVREQVSELETAVVGQRSIFKRACHDYTSFSLPAIFWKNYSPTLMRAIGDMEERTRYDVVIAEYSEMGMYLYRNPYLSAVRKVISCHRNLTTAFSKYVDTPEVPPMLRLKSAAQINKLERYESGMYRAVDHIITLTADDRFSLINANPELRVSIIPPGIDTPYLNDSVTPLPPKQIILMSGYFADKSNTDAALWFIRHVWPTISKRNPELKFVMVGSGAGPELTQLQKKDPNIIVTGEVDDMRPYRALARVLINPVRLGSGLRVKVLEAMASGLPVVSTSLGVAGIPAQNGVNCFIADTPQQIIQSIDWLLNDETLSKIMSKAAKELVNEHYGMEYTTHHLEKILTEVTTT